MARKYNKLSREALKMLLDGVSRREVKQYLVGGFEGQWNENVR